VIFFHFEVPVSISGPEIMRRISRLRKNLLHVLSGLPCNTNSGSYLIYSVIRLFVVVIGDDCTTDLQCQHSINNSRCRDGYCSCLSGYRQDVVDGTALNTACVRRKQLPRPICVVFSVGNILLLLQPFPS